MSLRVAILGAAGYGGSGLLRRLSRHPEVASLRVASRSFEGRPVQDAWPHLAGLASGVGALTFESPDAALQGVDVAFLATPHGATAPWVHAALEAGARVIDLSADSRLDAVTYARWYGEHPHPEDLELARYGLVEFHREELAGAQVVAAPGCNATAVSLALTPFVAAGWVSRERAPVCTVLAAASGAGRTPAQGLHFAELAENAKPYKVAGTHRHLAEIEMTLGRASVEGLTHRTQGEIDAWPVSFTPHLIPGIRGILTSCTFTPSREGSEEDLLEVLHAAYQREALVHVQETLPEMKAVAGTDRALLSVRRDDRTGLVTVFSTIDNLGKGAAGQAVQGFNVAFGFPETTGLELEGQWP